MGFLTIGFFSGSMMNWRDWAKYRVNLISAMKDGYGCVRGWGLPTHRQNRSQHPGGWCWAYVHGCMSLFVCKSTAGYRIDSSEWRKQILCMLSHKKPPSLNHAQTPGCPRGCLKPKLASAPLYFWEWSIHCDVEAHHEARRNNKSKTPETETRKLRQKAVSRRD